MQTAHFVLIGYHLRHENPFLIDIKAYVVKHDYN